MKEIEGENRYSVLNVQEIELEQETIDIEAVMKVPEHLARTYQLIAVGKVESKLKVAMVDPFNIYALDDLHYSTNMEILPVHASKESIQSMIEQFYTRIQTKHIMTQFEKKAYDKDVVPEIYQVEEVAESTYIKLMNNLLERCILKEASDLHIEPFEQGARVRYRIDGKLRKITEIKKEMLKSMTRCIKISAGLDIAEKRLPQDGRMCQYVNGQKVDLRVSILPTVYGEKTVIRFIYRSHKGFNLSEIGFNAEDYPKVVQLLQNPHGIILLTGPTGSGKSTTLAAALKWLNHESINIITVEDPVENVIEGINQVAVNPKVGLSFSSVLRAILRQDPDVIMIGEMRDEETARIAMRAAVTGHLVLSTLHTNDAISTIPRLIDMGIEDYMVGAAVKGVISQRLMRKLCPVCRKVHYVTSAEALIYQLPEGLKVYEPKGCKACHQIGYKGRFAIHEVLVVGPRLQEMIAKGKITAHVIKTVAEEEGMDTLWQNAYEHVLRGDTSMEELLRVTYRG